MKIDDDDMTMGIMVELLQLLLEIINVILIEQLKVNSRLVYVLLYQHDHITSFRSHATLGKLVTNIDSLLAFFSARLARPTGETLTSEETLEAIVAESHNWDQHRANSLVVRRSPCSMKFYLFFYFYFYFLKQIMVCRTSRRPVLATRKSPLRKISLGRLRGRPCSSTLSLRS